MLKIANQMFLTVLILTGCSEGSSKRADIAGEEVLRIASPDGRVTAVVAEEGFGATVAPVSSVKMVFNGRMSEVYRADYVRGLKVKWMDAANLEVTSECGRIFSFKNFFDLIDEKGSAVGRVNVWLGNSLLCSSNRLAKP
jgi:hypothetical protein